MVGGLYTTGIPGLVKPRLLIGTTTITMLKLLHNECKKWITNTIRVWVFRLALLGLVIFNEYPNGIYVYQWSICLHC